ncbi:MFS transporter (plasmid) [Roseobacter denitrificans]|uniref:Major facilitator superfamily protein n=1 Tax=Roseobacter denitrificans (strain ATCC 33942 / OCh 114) TaxID=375451 RepID=Q07GL1_ROSDO|nr:MFS transporter [Roseobacter denitrificans]ABI93388.1 major facilitator superfamily protein [Roseobacter denitrificans OCh 114]AVL51247.1 MFS transporter [Roseobacter denitrificans]SFG47608.1 Predicted arabinose efflux permease, MFS family [Roseobacter denitrificans OCh 114]
MSSSGSTVEAPSPGAFSSFGHMAFALLWTATLISNVGTWMHDVGAGWLMTTLNSSPSVVTLVQAATTLPVFLFALFAGALADRLDKRRMLITINILLTIVISTLTVLVWLEMMTPLLLILFTLAIGTGAAFMAPAWQAIVPQLVPREKLKPAIALNSMGINISRAIGPALAGILIASVGLAAPFALNAVSHLVIIVALLLWKPEPTTGTKYHGPILGDMATGLRHVRNNEALKATAIRAGAFFIFASAYWSLLPLIARQAEGGGSQLYGTLVALIGGGAVTGALLLPRLQKRLDSDMAVRAGTLGTIAALLIMALSATPVALMAAAFLGGFSWITVLTSFNVSAQMALPNWVRARGLAVFLMVFFGSMAAGSIIWGQVATATSIPVALMIAAAGLALGILVTRGFKVGQAENADLTPSALWPSAPVLSDGQYPDQRAMVMVEYQVNADRKADFLAALHAFSKERLRDGATQWFVHESVETPGLWIESFLLPSWSEHLEQHQRVTRDDADVQDRLRAFDTRETGPVVRHYISP